MIDDFKYGLVIRDKYQSRGLPMCRYRGRINNSPRLIVTLDLKTMKKFKSREEALFYLSNLNDKYGDQIYKWKPLKIDKIVSGLKQNPVRQLHTNKILSKAIP